MNNIACLLAAASVAAYAGSAEGGNSASAIVRQDPSSSLLWKTITSSPADVMLDWPKGAVKAVISVDGVVRATVTDPLAASAAVPFVFPASETEERMVTVSAAYFDGEGTVLKEIEVELALVCKADSGTVRHRKEGGREWSKARAKSVVLPLPGNAASLSVGGETVSGLHTAPGWYWWKCVPSASTDLALTLEDGSVYGNSVCGLAGLTVIAR